MLRKKDVKRGNIINVYPMVNIENGDIYNGYFFSSLCGAKEYYNRLNNDGYDVSKLRINRFVYDGQSESKLKEIYKYTANNPKYAKKIYYYDSYDLLYSNQ